MTSPVAKRPGKRIAQISVNTIRRRAQDARPPGQACELCESTEGTIDGHHPAIKTAPEWVIYCCRKCHLMLDAVVGLRKRNADKNCIVCGKPAADRRAKTKYCSHSCMGRHNTARAKNTTGETRLTCLACGAPNLGRINRGRRFCSRRCALIHRNRMQSIPEVPGGI